jgi:hypothetical protein
VVCRLHACRSRPTAGQRQHELGQIEHCPELELGIAFAAKAHGAFQRGVRQPPHHREPGLRHRQLFERGPQAVVVQDCHLRRGFGRERSREQGVHIAAGRGYGCACVSLSRRGGASQRLGIDAARHAAGQRQAGQHRERALPAHLALPFGTSFIPHFGHLPGALPSTSGCIGQACEAAPLEWPA